MATAQGHLSRLPAALARRVRRVSKGLYQALHKRAADRPKVLFIVGCQRSGTTLMTRLFDADFDCRVFEEHSELASDAADAGIRLKPLPEVAAIINNVRGCLV